ncbi:MAG: metal-dependent transcriptional regulator [Gemmatimonadales bacterium]|nr:metal-dependent transcriptional regulator [Gemmatimonadales bacterium]
MTTPDAAPEALTRSAEDYLKAILALSGDAPASTTHIALRLDLTPASVSGMIRRLSEQGLVHHEPYRGVLLTEAGRREALRMVRRHRLIESYLVARLGFAWDDVHDEAERLEHAVSDLLVERMAEALGNPRFDPHGDPIPSADGSMDVPAYTAVPELAPDETALLHRVDTGDADRLRYIADAGLVPGTPVTLVRQEPFDGPVTVRVGGSERVIAHDLASLLLCVRT